jgi:histidine triad (HIT) family protein
MAETCLFCKIVAGEIPAQIVYQDEHVTAFRDIHPQAPVHLLIIPNQHIPSVADLTEAQAPLLGAMTRAAASIAAREGISTSDQGYRLLINYGEDGGLVVYHLHMHLMGGRKLGWPPG